ncbi:MAG: cation:proton antiporter, partial [candidate division Zixibacteria bacterium]|nr:cation:proton antiporter [candidate division Zixibacteria bacterium]
MNLNLSKELLYVILIFALFVLPRIIQRFRIPTAVTSMLLGIAINHWYPQIAEDATVNLLATLGIVALFLFAGLDLKLNDVKSGGWILVQHIILGLLNIFIAGFIVMSMFKLSMSISMLVALALFTPSTGFILDSLRSIGVNETERFWIKSISIAAEIVALLLMFIIIQSTSLPKFVSSTLIMALLILFLPILFKLFAEKIVPYAPNS